MKNVNQLTQQEAEECYKIVFPDNKNPVKINRKEDGIDIYTDRYSIRIDKGIIWLEKESNTDYIDPNVPENSRQKILKYLQGLNYLQ
ncbi:MAG TPA: hypothetical protein VF691_19035 [Cytophagaceae bacterium]|jgi:hypothetical protein